MGSKVDKQICLKILDRGLYPSYTFGVFPDPELKKSEFFRGPAMNCDQFNNPKFQEFMRQYGINPETWIAVARMKNPGDFAVIKV